MKMASQRWRDRLLKELHRQGLPSSYVSRLVEELTDHAADLFKENPSVDAERNADARLGTPEHLAAIARVEFQRRTFAGRHPVLTFLVGPIVAVVGSFAGTFLTVTLVWLPIGVLIDTATGGCFSAADARDAGPSTFGPWLLFHSYSTIMRFIPFLLSAWIFVWLGRRSGLRGWSIVACGLIALIALFFRSKVTPANAPGQAQWLIDIPFYPPGNAWRVAWRIGAAQIVQAAVPLAFGVLTLRRTPVDPAKIVAA
jgi:hypothetical protein